MNWDAIGAAGELAGAIVVVVSVLYLARQIREGSRVARAESQRQLLGTSQIYGSFGANLETIRLFRNGLHHYEQLDPDEQGRFHFLVVPIANHVESAFRMYREGLLEDDSYRGWIGALAGVVQDRGGAAWWRSAGAGFGTDSWEATRPVHRSREASTRE